MSTNVAALSLATRRQLELTVRDALGLARSRGTTLAAVHVVGDAGVVQEARRLLRERGAAEVAVVGEPGTVDGMLAHVELVPRPIG